MAELREELDAYYSYIWQDGVANLTSFGDDLQKRLGPKRQELSKVIPITIAYCSIFIAGICGNVVTCIVICRNKYMHTATNYYLFNLAVADLLVLVLGLPIELYSFWSAYPWVFGEPFCVLRNMAAETATNAAILTITAFSIERYVAICHPMRAQRMSRPSRAIRIIILVWSVATLCSIPQAVQFGLVYVPDRLGQPIKESVLCNLKPSHKIKHTFAVATFLFFFTPMVIITGMYSVMAMTIRRSTVSRCGSSSSDGDSTQEASLPSHHPRRARRAVIKMLVAVVVAFFVCWAPFHAQRLMILYVKKWSKELLYIQMILFYISGVLYYISSTINPILYNIMSLKFRKAFRETLFWSTCSDNRKPQHTYTYKFGRHCFNYDTKSDTSEYCSSFPNRPGHGSLANTKSTVVLTKGIRHPSSTNVRVVDHSRHLPQLYKTLRPKLVSSAVSICTDGKHICIPGPRHLINPRPLRAIIAV